MSPIGCDNFPLTQILPLAMGSLRLELFSPWVALGMFAAFGSFIVILGKRSLAGLGPVRKWVAIGARLMVLVLVILILGDVKWVRRNTDVEVMVVRDISRSTELVHDFPGRFLQSSLDDYFRQITDQQRSPAREKGDKVGEISFNEQAYIDVIPTPEMLKFEARAIRGAGTGTDAAGAIQLGLASMDNDSLHRLVLVWDGNSTAGDLNAALAAAASQHVPIDVVPLKYNVAHEVMMDKFIAPTWRQEGQPFTIEVFINSTNPRAVEGNLSVTNNGNLMKLRDGKTTERIAIKPGLNREQIEVPAQSVGVHQFHAIVDGVSNITTSVGSSEPAASQLDNKSADTFTFVKGKGQILLVDNSDPEHQQDNLRFFKAAMADENIEVHVISPDQFPNQNLELQGYDAVVLANVPRGAGGLSDDQDRLLASYVHDTGGGLVMIGGPQTFGAGGWTGTRLEQELPVTMEVPAQRQIPKGALVLCMDPAEAPDGNYWGQQCAMKASEALSSLDEVGVISWAWSKGNGAHWDAPLAPKGDGHAVMAALKNWELGDLPDFDATIRLAMDGGDGHPGLIASDARAKHIIMITDDDPELPSEDTIQRLIANKITVSTITIYPHNPGNVAPGIVDLAKRTGGKNYGPIENNPNQLPQIFIKEATVVKRTIIQEDPKGIPVRLDRTASDLVKGLTPGPMPPLYGMDVTGRKDNPLIEIPITAGPKNDPVLAHWQAGLGRTAVYTGDAYNKWDAQWTPSIQSMHGSLYAKFWAQVIRGVARSPVSSDFEIEMNTDGDKGHIVVHAAKEGNAFNNFLTIEGTVAGGADLTPHKVRLLQTGPGTYEGDFNATEQGSYVGYFQYVGEKDQHGTLLAGTTVNTSPELRDLQSNDTLLKQIADRTGGRIIPAFDAASFDLFTREGLEQTSSPKSIWDILVPFLLGLIIIDVAIRRIAWDWNATRKMALAGANYVREFTTTYRKVENPEMLDNLKRVRGEVADQKFKPADASTAGANGGNAGDASSGLSAEPRPDRGAKFEAGKGVEGDIASIVGGATDKPLPSAPKKIEPKGTVGAGMHTGGLLEAKRRAQQMIKNQEKSE